ncbi:mitochondrial intermediate peptidase isoform X1 [Manduca sexta]|uniref:mitochondrial intermediate peptidase isoform X1 n=2 Tax=Manduca sexta TaxID=7130 RepID=UPI00188F33A5|nr:mitochondrial intermediate peptidase isoform X1 [Manduca sexta]XP_030031762.2 mitochondrial intermediate peptidase isoform X1 [Manduca sexta]XP_030031763.2 mitochondrial intermediate peptidase isoform X1 [Manduca sexta]
MKLLKPLWVLRHSRRKKLGCSVSTWSPLATAFNTRPSTRPIFDSLRERTGLFNKPELTSFEGFHALKEQAISATDCLIEEATSNPTRPMVEIFDELSDTLCKVADLAEFVRIAHPQSHFASAAEEACISVSGVVEKLNTHKGLYEALRDSVARGTSGDRHLAELFLFDFEQSGIQLEEGKRRRVVALNDVILQTGQRFMAGAARPRRVSRSAVPQNVRQFFSTEGDNIIVSGVYAECAEAAAREAAYRLYLAPDKMQDQLLTTTLDARHEMASVCGFRSYADRAIKASTMETAPNVRQFLDILSDHLHDRAQCDFDAMLKMKKQETPYLDKLMCWDTPYFTHKAKTQLLNVANSDFSPYFSLGGCMEGLNMLCQELYGISLKSEDMLPGESWSPDVYKLAVVHETEGLLGHIYCDLYERPGKPHQDCHFTIQGGKLLPDGTYQNPIVVIMLSLSGGHRSGPALLSAGAVDNLFHEAGHALHSMLGRARHQHVAGTRCATDLAEVPSVLMECFTSSPQVIRRFARHFQTREPMPEDMIHRLCASKYLFGASEMQLQVFYSALDQHYHGPGASFGGRTTEVLQEVQKNYYGLPYVENTAWQHRFSHLIGYGAKYYSYLISRGIAWSVWKKHFDSDPLSRSAGEGLRNGLLRHGGAVPPQILLREYLDTEITPEALANALAEELDYRKDHLDTVFKIADK